MCNRYLLTKFGFTVLICTMCSAIFVNAQEIIKPAVTNYTFLKNNGIALLKQARTARVMALNIAQQKGWEISRLDPDGTIMRLQHLDDTGLPVYYITNNNIIAARTTRTDQLYTGGRLGLSLNGSTIPSGKVAIWDGDAVFVSHTEFAGNRVEVKDNTTTTAVHSTHVAGTMIAAGANPLARGMAYGLPKLYSYNFDDDTPEMSAAAAGLLISNHSYGALAGWALNTEASPQRWEFYGAPNANEDYKFGYYDSQAADWDKICYNAPYYLPVKSAGNNRSVYGPAVGATYWRYNINKQMVNAGPRPEGISSNDGYDNIPTYGTAKNILTIGAVNPLATGVYDASAIQITAFSSWGPTDDGRIKPDLVADGIRVFSTSNAGINSYTSLSGTSMATPNVSGSLILLQELYSQKNQQEYMRSATLKALTIGSAAEAGTTRGPDYSYGWGLLNTEAAAQVILDNGQKSKIAEQTLTQAEQQYLEVRAAGGVPLKATLCWTDPEATPINSASGLNNSAARLVNDLDLRAVSGSTTYNPWILDPVNPAAPAVTGDNKLDNVEQVVIDNATAGTLYRFKISHKGNLKTGAQAYSVVISGIEGGVTTGSSKINGDDSNLNLLLYPVPANREINVNFNVSVASPVKISIYNVTGREMYTEEKTSFSGLYFSQINIADFPAGLYVMVIKTGINTYSRKFLSTK
jgi:hypothetical protein